MSIKGVREADNGSLLKFGKILNRAARLLAAREGGEDG